MKNKILLAATLLMACIVSSKAQQNYKPSEYDYIYQVQITTIKGKKVDWAKFKKLKDLGQLTSNTVELDPVETPGKTPIYLGQYLGKSTAKKILAEVQKRGYKNAKIVNDGGFALGHSTGKHVRFALQLGAFKSLKLVNVGQYPQKDEDDRIYLQYKGKAFKVFYGIYSGGDMPNGTENAKANIVPWLKKKGYQTFFQKFR